MKAHFQSSSLEDKKRIIIINDALSIPLVQGHENIITLKEVFLSGRIVSASREQKVFSVMIIETLRGGELFYHIKMCGRLTLETSRYYFLQLASALNHMHNKAGFAHRDLKPWNIMVNDDLTKLKIIDFGYATPLDPERLEQASRIFKGRLNCTKNYMAPELYKKVINFPLDKSDVFSLGVILINFLTGDYSFSHVFKEDHETFSEEYLNFLAHPQRFLNQTDESLLSLITGMLAPSMDDRLSISAVLTHPWCQLKCSFPQQARDELLSKQKSLVLKEQEQVTSGVGCKELPSYLTFTDYTTCLKTTRPYCELLQNLEKVIKTMGGILIRRKNAIQVELDPSEPHERMEIELSDRLNVIIELFITERNGQHPQICLEFQRGKGDYLSFVDFFVLIQSKLHPL
ncbi:hypothetical protein FGO68_gene4175 [Halteria grandinella]|uniref:non-specific serine/threonine protein kinase n=1 Tax=Halteria grandinella TaxID=5974 RepID=A0A8J8NGB9_HALGN|nr:hypothetical protein FGO68_gene4175 [Halteria grandinella]